MLGNLFAKLKRSKAEIAWRFDGTKVTVEKGRTAGSTSSDLADVLEGRGKSEVHFIANGRFEFFGDIPPALHQQIRNVLSQVT